jgi:hypothetical protein
MDKLLESTEMDGKSPDEQAKQAIVHVLKRIRSEAHIADAMGYGTQSFQLLTEAAASLFSEPVKKVRCYYAGMGEL